MQTTLNDLHIFPGQNYQHFFVGTVYSFPGQPYSSAPRYCSGIEGARYDSYGNPAPGAAYYPATVVDWVVVSIRSDPDGGPICQKAALMNNDGHIEFVNGGFDCSNIDMDSIYYMVIEHRNYLIVMSPEPLPIIDGTITFDFRSVERYIFDDFGFGGIGQKEILPGIFAMFAGNGNQVLTPGSDTNINFDDMTYWEGQNGAVGHYTNIDYNLNRDCNYNDRNTWEYTTG